MPSPEPISAENESMDNVGLLDVFLGRVESAGLTLYPAQEEAILELFDEKNVILNTPTGSGKSLVAEALHFKALSQRKRSIYTCPIKALVNEKWLALCRQFGPENVGLSTGDATINRGAPILCCTAEILSNIALREGAAADVSDVIMDEFHYYSDRERGVAWQVPLLTLSSTRFLLMSATLGDTSFFEEELTRLNGLETKTIKSAERPVPLRFSYAETCLPETLEELIREGKSPVYVVHFTQAEAARNAQNFTSLSLCDKQQKSAIARELEKESFKSPYGSEIKRWLRSGIGLHHAGLLPRYRLLTERLAQKGLLPVICGTDTLGVGINVPIRTVLFTQLCKYSGDKTSILSARDFHQISGRAGRKGFDDCGWVIAQAPEHVVENIQLERKQIETGKKFVKRKPPDKNYSHWGKETFEKLREQPPERLSSRFHVTHGMLLHVLSRGSNGPGAMRDLIRRSHETPSAKRAHTKRAWQLFRALLQAGIVRLEERRVSVNVSLQDDFSMNQTLSLYLHQTLEQLDRNAADYSMNVLTLVESILEDPEVILRRQLDKVKGRAIAEMKADGMDYEQRMEELEKLEYPKPNRDFIYSTFNVFASAHPWVGQENIRPKSIAREMFEEFRSFEDYIKLYDLQRSEGLLLRHLASVKKVLAQTVPDEAKDDDLWDIEHFLGALIRQVDSSLLDQWEKLRNPDFVSASSSGLVTMLGAEDAPADITRDEGSFKALVRIKVFEFLRAVSGQDFTAASECLLNTADWPPADLTDVFTVFSRDRGRLRMDPEARNARHVYFDVIGEGFMKVEQMLLDMDGINDWVAEFSVDIEASRSAGAPVLELVRVGPYRGV